MIKKGSLSMKDYLMKMKIICDTLAARGRPISEEDQVLSILAGVGLEFDPTVAVLTSSMDSTMLELQVHSSLHQKIEFFNKSLNFVVFLVLLMIA